MILDEFRSNRLAKLPLEYDLYDSDQEDEIKGTTKKKDRDNFK